MQPLELEGNNQANVANINNVAETAHSVPIPMQIEQPGINQSHLEVNDSNPGGSKNLTAFTQQQYTLSTQPPTVYYQQNANKSSLIVLRTLYHVAIWILLVYAVCLSTYIFQVGVSDPKCLSKSDCSFQVESTQSAIINSTATPSMSPTSTATNDVDVSSTFPSVILSGQPTVRMIEPTTTTTTTAQPTTTTTAQSTTTTTAQPTMTTTAQPTMTTTVQPTPMPTLSHGAIVQIQSVISHTKVDISATGAWIEPSTDYRVSITPKYLDSQFIISYNFGWNGYGIVVNAIVSWAAAKAVGSGSFYRDTITSAGIASGVRDQISGIVARRNNGYDFNDPNFCNWLTYDYPNTMETITYGLHMRQEACGGLIRIGESLTDDNGVGYVGWTVPVTIIAMEIRN